MGKRKSKAKQETKKRPKLDTLFTCPFCGHGSSVECKIDLKDKIATAECFICAEWYSTIANTLTEPIDVYIEWIDECELVNSKM